MSSKLSVALIGAGQIAGTYDENKINGDSGVYSHAGAYSRHGGFELSTVFDAKLERAEQFKNYWKVASVADDIKDVYSKFHNIVSVCTPDDTHYEIVKNLLVNRCCNTIFVEKPISKDIQQIEEIQELSDAIGVNVVVNFQRHNEGCHIRAKEQISNSISDVLAVNAYYIKGLEHIGITMVDTLKYIFGNPVAVYSYNKIYNKQVNDFSYEFILYYDLFNITVKTVDTDRFVYNYHIFEIDILLKDKRITIEDNSRLVKTKDITSFAYSGVAVLNDRKPVYTETEFSLSMLNMVSYIHDITCQKRNHEINTVRDSYNNKLIIDKIIQSYNQNKKIEIGDNEWKK